MLDEDIRAGLVDKNFTLDRVVNDRILKLAQQELRAEGKLKPVRESCSKLFRTSSRSNVQMFQRFKDV